MSRRPGWLIVARWELSRILRRKDFILSVLLTPLLLFGTSFLMTSLNRDAPHKVAITRVDAAGTEIGRGPGVLPQVPGIIWTDPGTAGADTAALAAGVRGKSYEAALVVRPAAAAGLAADLITRREASRWALNLREPLRRLAREEAATALGLSVADRAALEDTVEFRRHTATTARTGSRLGDYLVMFGVIMLMVMVLLTGMSYLMIGISGEKQARVTEVVVSAISAQAWMDGKIVAFTVIGVITGVIWAASLLALAGPMIPSTVGLVDPGVLSATVVFALLGLYLYNALIAALMASAQNMQTASKWQSNFIMIPFLPMFFLGPLLDNPDSLAMAILSQVPFFAPSMMPARMVQHAVLPWEIALAVVLLVGSCWLMRLFAGRAFRMGMLLYGKDATLPELIRWMRVK